MAENIKLRKRNFTVDQGYFYTIEEDRDNLLQKTDDGNTAFSYPLDTLISYVPLSLEFDGVYFWDLEQPSSNNVTIQRWKIDNYVCKLQQTINLTAGTHYYNSEAFSVEHYHTQLSMAAISGTNTVKFDDYWDDSNLMGFTTTSGDNLTIHLGPNSNGEEEDVELATTVSGGITISGTLQYSYAEDDAVNFYTHIWLFNNNSEQSTATGALYKIDAYTGEYIKHYPGGAYKDIDAATFYNVNSFTEYGDVDTLAYIKSTNMLFINIGEENDVGGLDYYGSMVMDNIQSNEASVLIIYDLAMDDQNVYRLQKGPDGGSGETWTYYSYELSSLDSFVTSISLGAYPAVIAANGVSTTDIRAIVKDQFLQPIASRLVYFSEDDPNGSILSSPVSTNANGLAPTVYKSGTSAREVKITAVVEQV
jgi:hypothetical protein